MGLRRLGLGVSWAALLLAGLVECGGTGSRSDSSAAGAGLSEIGGSGASAGSSGVAGSAPGTCATPSADGYQPMWTPPSAPMIGACTQQQVSREYSVCYGATYNQNACHAFESDPANSTCLSCVFGVLGTPNVGAILVLPGNEWISNRGGCIALLDGDSSATGCGAKAQAATVCAYTACNAACTRPVSDKDLAACENGTASGACRTNFDNAVCEQLPRYASCAHSNFADYFNGFADLFCVSGLPGSIGAGGEAGAGP